jgi:lipopolysaccharide transport system permease protein
MRGAESLLTAPPVLVIEPSRGIGSLRLAELWEYRELLYFLVWRDLKVRYKQTVLGAVWAILQPLATAVVFTLFFGRIAKISSDDLPYPLFAYTGLLIWTLFSQGLMQASNSLVGSANLITKVYFPRLCIPVAAVIACLVDLAVAFPLLVALMAYHRVMPGLGLLALPAFLLLALLATIGVGLWLSALNVRYRDVRHAVPFLIQLWLFLSPVIYPASLIAPRLEKLGVPGWILGCNPVAGAVEGFRWALLRPNTNPWPLVAASTASTFVILVTGMFYFRSVERSFADVV